MKLSDRLFLRRLRSRDEEAFTELVRQHEKKIFSLLFRMLGNRAEAEDLSQEVFVTVFKTIDTFRGDSALSTWMCRIAINLCKNRFVSNARHATGHKNLGVENERRSSAADTPETILFGTELEKQLNQAILSLDPDHRTIVILRDIENLTYEEIVDITGVELGTVKSRLSRARQTIRNRIAHKDEDLP